MAKKKTYKVIVDNKPNSDMSPKERRLMELINGAEPKDDSEKQMLKEIQEVKAKGHTVWIPSGL
jgi:bisphosphoglycerate-independent phosphoglycerate mutase (AlkP superfamily)